MDDIIKIITAFKNPAVIIATILVAGILVWIVLREVKCWYWKINNILEEQQKQTEILETILREMKSSSANQTKQLQTYFQKMQTSKLGTAETENDITH